ncbi:MAG: tkt1 [Blastococcus sp.]|nr:tkt1 [Blastococcus sp.]
MPTGPLLERGRCADAAELARRADWIRRRTIDLIDIAGTGHYASTFSCAEVLAVLYYDQLRLRRGVPDWPDRDRFLLGKGHVAVGLYPCLADLDFFPSEWLDEYTRLGNALGDHPDMKTVPGVDFSSGSIGHNLSVGVGMALSARLRSQDFRTFVLLGDGELHEGQVWEAAMSASHFGLGNLVAIVDANGISLDGPVSDVMGVEPMADKWRAFGWRVVEIDGNDTAEVLSCFAELPPTTTSVPTVVIARTKKGAGVSFMELDPGWHLGYLGDEDRARAIAEIDARLS